MAIFLDSASTTPVSTSALSEMLPYLTDKYYNPSSIYEPSRIISNDVENARYLIADYLGCETKEIFFTSGASESNSWAFQGWLKKHPNGAIITTSIEHHSIMEMVDDEYIGKHVSVIGVSSTGEVVINYLSETLKNLIGNGVKDILVAIQFANNEIGTIQNMGEVSRVVKEFGATLFTDATQAFSCLDMRDVCKKYEIDMMSMSGHKIGCPKGIGFLYKRNGVDIAPIIYGSQNFGLRGGTENVPYIIALKSLTVMNVVEEPKRIKWLRDSLYERINNITPVRVNGAPLDANRLPNNLSLTFMDENLTDVFSGEAIVALLSNMGVYVSMGSACNAHSTTPSHVLSAIGLPLEEAINTIRISIPHEFSERDIQTVVDAFKKIVNLTGQNSEIKTELDSMGDDA